MDFVVDTIFGSAAGPISQMVAKTFGDEFVEPEILLEKLRPGDLIEFDRGTYCHWAMYSDQNGYIFNVCAEDKSKNEALISHDKLINVTDLVQEKRKVRINNLLGFAEHRGLEAFSAEKSVEIAKKYMGKVMPYDFLSLNCEFYCTRWKFGRGFTKQGQMGSFAVTDAVRLSLGFGFFPVIFPFIPAIGTISRGITNQQYDQKICEANKRLDDIDQLLTHDFVNSWSSWVPKWY